MNKNPFVLCLTNTVAANFTANVLLAIGAKPAMIEEPSEAAELASSADAILINLGTVHSRQAEAMRMAVDAAAKPAARKVPWVLDPVACHLLSYRAKLTEELIAKHPALIRGNHAEIDFLRKNVPAIRKTTVLSTGEVDRIYAADGADEKLVEGGVEMLQTVTATGCAQGAVCAAMLGKGLAPLDAAGSASRLMKRAGENAWSKAKTPGAFAAALIDALYELSDK